MVLSVGSDVKCDDATSFKGSWLVVAICGTAMDEESAIFCGVAPLFLVTFFDVAVRVQILWGVYGTRG